MTTTIKKGSSPFAFINTGLAVIAILGFCVPVYRVYISIMGMSEEATASVMQLSPMMAAICIFLLLVFIFLQFSWRKNWLNLIGAFIAAGPFLAVSPEDFNDYPGAISYLSTMALPIIASVGLIASAIIAYAISLSKSDQPAEQIDETSAVEPTKTSLRWRGQLLWAIAMAVLSFTFVYISITLDIEYLWMASGFLAIAAAILFVLGLIGLIINRSTFREHWTLRQWLVPAIIVGLCAVAMIVTRIATKGSSDTSTGPEYVFLRMLPGDNLGKVSLVDAKGNTITNYDENYEFSEVGSGAFWINSGSGYMLYNISNPQMPVRNDMYPMVTPFGDGVAAVGDGLSPIKLVNTKGETIVELPAWICEVGAFADGLAPFCDSRNHSWGYIDTKGNVAIKAEYLEAYPFYNGIAQVGLWEGCTMSMIDKSGKPLSFDYDHYDNRYDIDSFFDEETEKWGVRDVKTNKVLIPPMYSSVLVASNDRIIVYSDEQGGIVDRENRPIVPLVNYASIYPLAFGNFLYTAPDAASGTEMMKAGRGADPIFVPGYCTWIMNSNGKKSKEIFGTKINILTTDAKVTYTDLGQALTPVLDQLKYDEAFGFKTGTTVPEVAKRLDWNVSKDNLINFRHPYNIMSYYPDLPGGESCDVILKFDGELTRPVTHTEERGSGWLTYEEEVLDGYEFNPETKLSDIYIRLNSVLNKEANGELLRSIEKAVNAKGLDNVTLGRYQGEDVIKFSFQ